MVTEETILQLAIKRGVLSPEELGKLNQAVPDATVETGRWGPRIQHLLNTGRLTEAEIETLASTEVTEELPNLNTFQMDHLTLVPTVSDAAFPIEDWDRYQLTAFLGEGGMGRVFKGYDPRLKRNAAVKFILGESQDRARRFIREAQAQARIDHEHVCKIYEVGEVQDKLFIAMQYIEGTTLDKARKEMTLREKVAVLRDVAEGIHTAHRLGMIHRDIKPGNIMVERRDTGWHPYVMDFGLARPMESAELTQVGFAVGTPAYMSPEQASGDQHLDRRSDVYSLGAALYAILCGRPPIEGSSPIEVLSNIANQEPTGIRQYNKEIPRELETIVLKCLEKDPTHRYDTARALADDLQRFLDGEPIQARSASWTYRIGKKIRKNPTAFAIVSLAIAAAIVLGILGLRARWMAQEQARAAQQFGQDVEQINAIMRYAYMLPIHDISREKMLVRQRMEGIRKGATDMGRAARAPGDYAIGWGHLALHEYPEARQWLTRAWDAGYRSPEVSYALGLVFGTLYQQELDRAEGIGDSQLRSREIRKIESEYRDPALRFLKSASGSQTVSGDYVAARMALYQKQYSEALRRADLAWKDLPWYYEAIRLKGDVFFRLAVDARDRGDFEAARQNYGTADEMYRQATDLAKSDPESYESQGKLWLSSVAMEAYYTGGDVQPPFDKLILAVNDLTKIEPRNAAPLVRRSEALTALAGYRSGQGQDPNDALNEAIQSAKKAIEMDSASADGYTSRAVAYLQLADAQSAVGEDPQASLRQAIKDFLQSIRINPSDSTYNDLGTTYRMLAEYEGDHGMNPVENLNRSISAFQDGLKINGSNHHSFNNLGTSYDDRGVFELDHGRDPQAYFRLAKESFQKAVELNPRLAFAFSNLGNTYVHIASWDLQRQSDPTEALRLAVDSYGRAIKIIPKHANFYSNLAVAGTTAAVFLIRMGHDPEMWLKQAEEAVATATAINATDYYLPLQLAEIYLLRAHWTANQGKDPSSQLNQARNAWTRSVKMNQDDPEAFTISAEIWFVAAEWSEKNGRKPQTDQGIAEAQRALKINSDESKAMALEGALLILQSRSGPEKKQGQMLLEQAVRLDPSLKLEFKKYLES